MSPSQRRGLTRREVVLGGLGLAAAGAAGAAHWQRLDPLSPLGDEDGQRAAVFLARAETYDHRLGALIREGLAELGVGPAQVRGKRVLLKPNLVETARGAPHINTHPLVVQGAVQAFRELGAAAVAVAEGQGHRRDAWLVLEESGLLAILDEEGLDYTDLNHDALRARPNAAGLTRLDRLVLPRRLDWADLLVSLPKLKTHHWVGCTLAMKNLFGVMPGIYYGWPKNVLHQRGIVSSILDINATVRPDLAIVDGIVGMEGDGPILGQPRPCGILALGRSLPSVDATCARLMNLRVEKVRYLPIASRLGLGPVRAQHIEQRGVAPAEVQSDFALVNAPHLAGYKAQ